MNFDEAYAILLSMTEQVARSGPVPATTELIAAVQLLMQYGMVRPAAGGFTVDARYLDEPLRRLEAEGHVVSFVQNGQTHWRTL